MKRIITFGEIMLRLNPEAYKRFVQADRFEASYSGGEANAAISLAQFGMDAAFVTKLPAHEVGQSALNQLRRFGVNTQYIIRGGERLGLYYIEKGASQRASKVIYDRAGSAIAMAKPEDFDWEIIFKGADWFHWTGITPALSENMEIAVLDASKTAKKMGVQVSCDLNFRKKLWSSEKANKIMSGLMPYVDICIANEEDAFDVFGIKAESTDINKGELSRDAYVSVAKQLCDRFGFEKAAITLRASLSASDNNWSGLLFENGKAFFAPNYPVHIVDRVGGGDSFGAGLIYSQLSGWDNQKSINFAVAASCLKHSVEQDFNLLSVDEVETLVRGNASGRVQR